MGSSTLSSPSPSKPPPIWWSQGIIFISIHVAAIAGVCYFPPSVVSWWNLVLMFVLWRAAVFGVTIGYHRLYSHRAFRASFGLRVVLAAMGAAAFQGSIKGYASSSSSYDLVHDPYPATRGMLFSHMGWIFFNPTFEKMKLVDKEDLDNDSVVRLQHRYYVPLALFIGFVLPSSLGLLWGEPLQAFIWGGLVSKLFIWHSILLLNSLAHWNGHQPYSDEDTSRGNLIVAVLTGGEGSHNFVMLGASSLEAANILIAPLHTTPSAKWVLRCCYWHLVSHISLSLHTFPHDFRSGPTLFSWDPSKWFIYILHYCGLITGLRRAREKDVNEARSYMTYKETYGVPPPEDSEEEDFEFSSVDHSGTQSDGDSASSHDEEASGSGSASGSSSRSSGSSTSTMRTRSSNGRGKWPMWTMKDVEEYVDAKQGRCVLVIGEWVVDATSYLGEHPGGGALLRKYAFKKANPGSGSDSKLNPESQWPDSTWAFEGGLNNHSRTAVRRMKDFRLGRYHTKTAAPDEN
ncbi:hypothetical protein D9758_010555 [Tetrapyrgos nigripes]|uniref:Cytochrome b5 heme-binding domain-containing protein n=1 Tax=Tetrapyrgos nigripes TaxID=182062 RepID=A0A8H5FYH0_9AGAR|nr:hypothetical protein D9758_010555 [Tetrapyrgos nigripes]